MNAADLKPGTEILEGVTVTAVKPGKVQLTDTTWRKPVVKWLTVKSPILAGLIEAGQKARSES